MHAIKGGWAGQTFAQSKSNESGGTKSRIRRSKEERKGMAELFIKKYQSLNNGSFPSLNLTHKEVGGSFYTVREIVREIIQENRVLGPAKFLPEEQDFHEWSQQYPLGTISTEPQSSSALTSNGSTVPSDQRPSSHEEFSFSSHGLAEIHDENAETGQIINASFVVVSNAESDQLMGNEFQATKNKVAPIEDLLVPTDASIDNNSVKARHAEVQVGDAIQDSLRLEVGESHEQMKASVEDQAIGTKKSPGVADAVIDSPALEVQESERGMSREVQEKDAEKADLVPSKNCSSSPKKGSLEHSAAGDDKYDIQNSSSLERKSAAVNKQASNSPVGASVVGFDPNTVKKGVIHDSQLCVEEKSKLSNGQASSVKNRNAIPNATSKSTSGRQGSDTQASVSGNKPNVERSKSSQKRGDPALDRINIRSWQRSSRIPSQAETNPLWAAFQAFVTAFVKFWSE